MSGALGTHPGKTGKVSAEWNQADGLHSEYLDAGAGGQAFEDLRHVDLGGVRGEGAVPEDSPLGAGSSYVPDDRVRNASVKTAARTPPSTRWTVQPPTTRLVWGRWMPRPWSSRQA